MFELGLKAVVTGLDDGAALGAMCGEVGGLAGVRVGQTALRCRKSVIILSVTSEALSSGIVMVGREQDDVVLDRKNIEARKANMAEDYGLKSFNGIIFALLGIMALAVLLGTLFFHFKRPITGAPTKSPASQSAPSSSTAPQ